MIRAIIAQERNMLKMLPHTGRTLYLIAAILVLRTPMAGGQGKTGVQTWGFVNARIDTRSSASIYTGYGWRGMFAMGGMVQNPRAGTTEVLGGIGAAFRIGARTEHWLAVASARTGGISSAQVFWLPTLRAGGVTTRAQVKWTAPYEGRAPQKLSVSPLSVTRPVAGRLAAGMAIELAAAENARTAIATGPQLRLRLPRATLTTDVLRDVAPTGSNGSRVRLFFASLF